MKRKGSRFSKFFAGLQSHDTVHELDDAWIVKLAVLETDQPLREKIRGRWVISLDADYHWLYWVPKQGDCTGLVYLNAADEPVWCYADVIAEAGLDEAGFPWTSDAYLDVISLASRDRAGRWTALNPVIIDQEDLENALKAGTITANESKWAETVAARILEEIATQTYRPFDELQAFFQGR